MEAKGKEELSKCGGRRKPSWEINAHENGNSRQETKQMTLGATQRMENHWLGGKGQFCFALLSLRFKASGLSIKESVRKRKYSQKKKYSHERSPWATTVCRDFRAGTIRAFLLVFTATTV